MTSGYDLSRAWFDYAFEHSRTVRPIHTAIYFWCIEKANRLGWVDEFQLPTDEACRALGIKDPKSFRAALDELIQWGIIRLIQQAASQNVARWVSLNGCSFQGSDALDRVLSNDVRLSEKRSSDTPSGTPTSPLNTKPQTTNHKPQTEACVIEAQFEELWSSYEKKTGSKKKAFERFGRLSEKDRQEALLAIPAYKAYKPDPQFRKDPERYIGDRLWENDFRAITMASTAKNLNTPAIAVITSYKQSIPD